MPHIRDYTERQNRALQRITEMLSATETRTRSNYEHLRKHDRRDFQGQVLICMTAKNGPPPSEEHPSTFPAWAYSISSGGIGFLSPEAISAKIIAIGLKRPDGTIRWMNGIIVRTRQIPGEEFSDYGVAFQRTAHTGTGTVTEQPAAGQVRS
jgi:hypothetical protein